MGITGLLPILKSTLKKTHIKKFKNKKIGIDGYAWLYQILNSVAEELYLNTPTVRHIKMFENKLKSLIHHGIIPIVIFDGDFLSPKEKTNIERKERKEKYKEEVEMWINKNNWAKAREIMKRCVSVTRNIIHEMTTLLKNIEIEYFIAPYEADAQLCYLENIGYIDCIMTEDSDMIPFGCKNILFKFDNSYVDHYTIDCLEKAKDKIFKEFIQDICILSGCDYADSIPGIGVLTAHKFVSKGKEIENVVKLIGIKKTIPENYIENFKKAKITFNHQIVYDPITNKRRHLKPIEIHQEFLGTLENVEYSYEIKEIEGSLIKTNEPRIITVERHFKPVKDKEITLKDISVRKKEKKIDENLYSPYFKNE
ncbi:exonuclease 1 [Vairimorpha necatrix]|uniref:Exonuclease 1 n=1 Tax=Vairimorpha necatrix TaxID=6039 RepID=A0AAX4J8I5_9MICR